MGKLCRVIAVFIARLCRNSTDVWGKILSEGKEKKAFCHVAHNGNFSSCSEYIIECKIKSSRLHQLILSQAATANCETFGNTACTRRGQMFSGSYEKQDISRSQTKKEMVYTQEIQLGLFLLLAGDDGDYDVKYSYSQVCANSDLIIRYKHFFCISTSTFLKMR